MTDNSDSGENRREGAYDQATVREWARKTWLRQTMRSGALPDHELKTLDERLARWTKDQQLTGKLPPDWQLLAQRPLLEREFRQGRDEARPFFTPEEQRIVDASRAAAALRDRIDAREDYGPALSQLATLYMVTNGVVALEARSGITQRFGALYGRSVVEYARDQQRGVAPGRQTSPEPLFPAELGWDRYEAAGRRLAAHDAMMYVARQDGTLTNREYHERKKYRDNWVLEQQKAARLPTLAEMRKSRTPFAELLLPHQKKTARQERQRSLGEEGAYMRRIDELAGYVKLEIDESRRYVRALDDYAIDAAGAYGKGVDRAKRDIEERFALHYLDRPAEYLEARLERERSRKDAGRTGTDNGRRPDAHDRER